MSNTIGGLIFGLFCMFVVVGGIVYFAAMSNQSPPTTDSYGNTLGNTTNTSQDLAATATSTPGIGVTILLGSAIVLIVVIFGFYAFSKVFL